MSKHTETPEWYSSYIQCNGRLSAALEQRDELDAHLVSALAELRTVKAERDELVAALSNLLDWCAGSDTPDDLYKAGLAALAKATAFSS